VFTGVTRNSKNILKDITNNIEKAKPLLGTLDKAYSTILQDDYGKFLNYLNKSWMQKKKTSSTIVENNSIKEMDEFLSENDSVISHKLCGAGNGGFFLVFSERDSLTIPYQSVKMGVTSNGVSGIKI
jgi:galactokinase/mevalonate kinase-like predicted kinase